MNRRAFLGGALAATGVAALPLSMPAFAAVPAIHGDGFHDDTAGLQAALSGKPFRCVGTAWVIRHGEEVHISAGSYRLTDTLNVRDGTTIVGSHFDATAIPDGKPALCICGSSAQLIGCCIERPAMSGFTASGPPLVNSYQEEAQGPSALAYAFQMATAA